MLLAFSLAASNAHSAEPVLRDINVRGLEIGATTTLIVDGDELGPVPRLLLPFPTKQELKPGATDKRATIDIALAAGTSPEQARKDLEAIAHEVLANPVIEDYQVELID